jgi:hypothetical protein
LTDAARSGQPAALTALRTFLNEHPYIAEQVGDLTTQVQHVWLAQLTTDPLVRECVQQQLNALTHELRGATASPLEHLLVEQVGLAYLADRVTQLAAVPTGASTPAGGSQRLKRTEVTQRRQQAALRTLAQVRAVPVRTNTPPLRVFTPQTA